VRDNFGVSVQYYLAIQFDGVVQIVNAMGGLDIDLTEATAGYEPGHYHMDGDQALAFVRSRKGADDFYRMANAQLFIGAVARQMMAPRAWARIPAVTLAAIRVIDTNLPPWELARVGVAMLRGFVSGIDSRTFTREMVTPFQTAGGADVLLPNWNVINPVLFEMFGE
jgi:anionic cell wall polymer biosynthesis LytR-Cps2A-Psr (LCP) family protein